MKRTIRFRLGGMALTLGSLLLAFALADDIPGDHGGPSRASHGLEQIPPPRHPLRLSWEAKLACDRLSAIIEADGFVFVSGVDGAVYALDRDSGALLWTFPTRSALDAAPTFFKGRLYIGSRRGVVSCLRARTGSLLWTVDHGVEAVSSPIVVDDALVVALGDGSGTVIAYHALTGKRLWRISLGEPIAGAPAGNVGRIVLAGADGRVTCLRADKGTMLWSSTFGSTGAPILAIDARRVYAVNRDIVIADLDTGRVIQKAAEDVFEEQATSADLGVDPLLLKTVVGMPKRERDAVLAGLAASEGRDYTALRDYLDVAAGDIEPHGAANGAPICVRRGGIAVHHGRIVVTYRRLGGTRIQDTAFMTDAILGVTATRSMSGRPDLLRSDDPLPTPWITEDNFGYLVLANRLVAYDLATVPNPLRTFEPMPLPEAASSITASNGKIYITTSGGRILAYATLNTPPQPPTSFSPANDENVTAADPPLVRWSGQFDVDREPLAAEMQYGLGLNAEVDLSEANVLVSTGGSSCRLSATLASNTWVHYRIRVKDTRGAWSRWSAEQTFWVKRHTQAPEPISKIEAVPGNRRVDVFFGPSPSPDVVWYSLYSKPAGETWASARVINNIPVNGSPISLTGLDNFTSYDVMIVAVDAGLNPSAGVTTSVVPRPAVLLNGGASYARIQDAIDGSSKGDAIWLGADVFYENLTLKPGVSLIGVSPERTKIVGAFGAPVIHVKGVARSDPQSRISDLSVIGGTGGVYAGTADVQLQHVIVRDSGGHAVEARSAAMLMVTNATIVRNSGNGLVSASPDTVIRNVVAIENNGVGIQTMIGSIVTYNDSFGNMMGNFSGPVGIGNISVPPRFTPESLADQNYIDAQDSPTVDTGDPSDDASSEPLPNGARVNMGAYGNSASAAKSRTLASVAEESTQGPRKALCYIATASLGPSSNPTALARLYLFRDEALRSNAAGSVFAAAYASGAPKAAAWIHTHESARAGTARFLVVPAAALAGLAAHDGFLFAFLLCAMTFCAARRFLACR